MGKPMLEAQESPPFEKPSIEQVIKRALAVIQKQNKVMFIHFLLAKQGVNNFVQYKFSHLPSKERQTIMELAKMFLNQINYWQLETPSQRRQRVPNDDAAGYKANYTR